MVVTGSGAVRGDPVGWECEAVVRVPVHGVLRSEKSPWRDPVA